MNTCSGPPVNAIEPYTGEQRIGGVEAIFDNPFENSMNSSPDFNELLSLQKKRLVFDTSLAANFPASRLRVPQG
jgi:hypothetical protein